MDKLSGYSALDPPKGESWGIVVGITQDPQDYLRIASAFNGVFKYDGYQITGSKTYFNLKGNYNSCLLKFLD